MKPSQRCQAVFTALSTDIPTLILAGEFDQNTPAYWGKLAGETLSSSHYIEYPGAGHGVINQGICVLSMMMTFFDNPLSRPENSYGKATTGPAFVTPETDKGEK